MPASNICLDVRWREPVIYAGEEIECIITFRNVARANLQYEREKARSRPGTRHNSLHNAIDRQRNVTESTAFTKPSFARYPSITSNSTYVQARGHRQTLSLGVEPNTPKSRAETIPAISPSTPTRPSNAHGRSLSILSLGTERGGGQASARTPAARPSGHGRAASLQFVPQNGDRAVENAADMVGSIRQTRRSSQTNGGAAKERALHGQVNRRQTSSDFRFPTHENPREDDAPTPTLTQDDFVRSRKLPHVPTPISPGDTSGMAHLTVNPLARVLSETSGDGTPRTSTDFYAGSAISDEPTFPDPQDAKPSHDAARPSLSTRASSGNTITTPTVAEHLMMGYVQTVGGFTVDGSLINQAPFEEVKRRGVVSTQAGGGVVGIEKSKRESGLFGAFGWGNIGESLTGLLGMDEMSSVREMRNTASTKTIPLLSTPQTILFVDLRLAPEETRSYSYTLRLPKGLPPSYKGRSIKITYHLRIATQRAGRGEAQKIRDVEIPFRILGSVDRSGEVLGHDLMSPYIMLQDISKVAALARDHEPSKTFASLTSGKSSQNSEKDLEAFLQYTQDLLAKKPDGAPLLSPTIPMSDRRVSVDAPQMRKMTERIDLAITRSTHASAGANAQSSSRFTIARAGLHVGILSILRPAYRLGETVLVNLSFSPPATSISDATTATAARPTTMKAYIVVLTLETTEKVDPSLALRSATSIARVTRRVHASVTDTVLFADQAAFSLAIPTTATPSFDTTGISLEWRVKVEFTTSPLPPRRASDVVRSTSVREDNDEESGGEGEGEDEDEMTGLGISHAAARGDALRAGERNPTAAEQEAAAAVSQAARREEWLTSDGLLEIVSADDRGRVLVARETLVAETFEVAVPIKVYGVQPPVGPNGSRSDVYQI